MKMIVENILRFLITLIVLVAFGIGIFDYLQNIDSNDCSMTYMRSPIYIPIKLDDNQKSYYPNYQLFHQCEKEECSLDEKVKFTKPGSIPVLFITGNADSHKQVRSIAALSLSKSEQQKYLNEKINYNFFTITFNEELSALYGPVLVKQTKFVQSSIKRILSLYKSVNPESKQPKSVVLVGNSMGGIIARGIFVIDTDKFNASNYVHTIITQASPHRHAIVSTDRVMTKYYDDMNSFWFNKATNGLGNILLVSLYGGNRDILVRNNLASLDQSSNARIISKLTTTIPYVWRSVDHRCMAWCKEFVLVLNRALFKLIDKETHQIFENREKRENIFNYYLINDNFELGQDSKKAKIYTKDSVKIMNEINLSFNGFNKNEIIYVFEFDRLKDKLNDFDSLFIYTNMAKFNSFLACKQFILTNDESYECVGSFDLYTKYGSSLPPNELGRDIGLKILNIEKILSNFQYLLIRVPIWRKSEKNYYQAILNLDWYNKEKRSEIIDVPNLIGLNHARDIEIINDEISYKRLILNDFNNIGQSFKFDYIPNDCQMLLDSRKSKVLSSNVQIKFAESDELFTYSQITNLKHSNLSLRLSKNRKHLTVLHVYIFKLKHLINDEKCSNKYNFQLKISYSSIFGQLIRFYALLLPSFLVIVIQFIDYLIMKEPSLNSKWFVLSGYLTKFQKFTMHVIYLTFMVFLNLNFFNMRTDFDYLQSIDEIFSLLIIPVLYISSYVLVSLSIGLYFSLIFSIFRKLFSRVISFIYSHVNKYQQLSLFNCIAIIASGLYLPILSHVYVFYIELVGLITSNKIKNRCFTRVLVLYILVIIKIPALLVWVKDLNSLNFDLNEIIKSVHENDFLDFDLVIINFVIYVLNWFRFFASYKNNFILKILILLNSCLTMLFSSLNLYRLPYFIFLHLFLMTFYGDDDKEKKE